MYVNNDYAHADLWSGELFYIVIGLSCRGTDSRGFEGAGHKHSFNSYISSSDRETLQNTVIQVFKKKTKHPNNYTLYIGVIDAEL